MKKKNLNWLLALLAALALVFAFAGCADNGAGDGNTTNPSEEEEPTPCCNTDGCTQDRNCTVCTADLNCCSDCGSNACQVETCNDCTGGSDCTGTAQCTVCGDCACTECKAQEVQKTTVSVTNVQTFLGSLGTVATGVDGSTWSFSNGEWDTSGETPTYTLSGTNANSSSANVSANTVLGHVQSLSTQTSGDGSLTIDFSVSSVTGWDETPSSTDAGEITVTVKLANSTTHEFDSDSLSDFLNEDGDELDVTLVFDITKVTSGSWQ